MVQLLGALDPAEGIHPSPVDGVRLQRVSRPTPRTAVLYEPCLVIVAQGAKRFHLPDRVLRYDPRHFLLLTVPVPAECETEMGESGPFLAVAVRIDLTTLSELLSTLGPASAPRGGGAPGEDDRAERPETPPMDASLSGAVVRLLECMRSPDDARVLGPTLVRELLYRVLQGAQGEALRGLLLGSEQRARIHRILERMHLDCAAPLDLPRLAHDVGMSVSALHAHFKAVTGTSPVQYLKTLRLHRARQLLVQSSLSAGLAAERVGYASASQFSREFKRLFGVPPAEEAQRVRATFGLSEA